MSRFKAGRLFFGWLVFALLMIAQVTRGQTDADQSAIRAAIKSYVEAYNRGDAKAVADHWSEKGQWVSPDGAKHTGKEAIAKALAALFEESKGVTITVDGMEQTLRAVTDTAGRFTLNPAPPGRFFVHIDAVLFQTCSSKG